MSTDCEESPRILSIQSTVVSGYVGNKVAVFPLQVSFFLATYKLTSRHLKINIYLFMQGPFEIIL